MLLEFWPLGLQLASGLNYLLVAELLYLEAESLWLLVSEWHWGTEKQLALEVETLLLLVLGWH